MSECSPDFRHIQPTRSLFLLRSEFRLLFRPIVHSSHRHSGHIVVVALDGRREYLF